MAVPKKKRSRQIVRSRRSASANKLLNKHNILIKNYSNFISVNSIDNSKKIHVLPIKNHVHILLVVHQIMCV